MENKRLNARSIAASNDRNDRTHGRVQPRAAASSPDPWVWTPRSRRSARRTPIARRPAGPSARGNRSRASGEGRPAWDNRSRASGEASRTDRAAIAELHTYARPAGSKTERQFIKRFIASLPGATQDDFGNWHVVIDPVVTPGTPTPNPTILWSCHTDTVARRGGRQRVILTEAGMLMLDPSETSRNCLGADDTAGIWILREMIAADIPGRYVFHDSEEIGAIGSGDLARYAPHMLDGITCAVAFDRAGTGDIVTHQLGDRCASETFALSVSDAINAVSPGLTLRPAHGSFTDTASYMDLIPECTNLSVGYEHAHSAAETLDTTFLIALRDAMLAVNVAAWTVTRDPLARSSEWAVDLADVRDDAIEWADPLDSPFDSETDRHFWSRMLERYR